MAGSVVVPDFEVVLADILAGEQHAATTLVVGAEHRETVAESLNHSFGAEIAAADTYGNNEIACFTELLCAGFDVGHKRVGGLRREFHPSEEVGTQAAAVVKFLQTFVCLRVESLYLPGSHGAKHVFNINI